MSRHIIVRALNRVLEDTYAPDTTINWNPFCPAEGHCAVASMVVQDWVGGTIGRATYTGEMSGSHYFNQLNGLWVWDLTSQQFDGKDIVLKPDLSKICFRTYLIRSESTMARYRLLSDRVSSQMSDMLGVSVDRALPS